MKKVVSMILAVSICLSLTGAFAAGKLNVVQENFHVIPSYSTYGYAYAKVENSGDKPIKVNAGVLEIYDEAGDAITSTDYMSAHAEYLQPGEYTYVKLYSEIEDGRTADDYSLTLTGKSDNENACLRLPCTMDMKLNEEDGWWVHNYIYATVTNNTDQPLYEIEVVLALLDAEGNILHIESDNLYNERALTPGSSMIIRKDIYSDTMEYFAANGLVPASVDAIAFVNVEVE